MEQIFKYPRTRHIEGSKLQKGDEDLSIVSFSSISNKYLVIEEKIDGANSGISFDSGVLKLQSRGHFLTGGYRERHFDILKKWANVFAVPLYEVLGEKYIMYGEWMYAKHTVFYDKLPHYFMEFDILDKETGIFLSTERRREMLTAAPFVCSVPVLKEGRAASLGELTSYVRKSLYKSDNWKQRLQTICEKENLRYDLALSQTDNSDLAEGIYIKVEENGSVIDRCKFVRREFIAQILSSDSHWLDRPIIPNVLERGELDWTY